MPYPTIQPENAPEFFHWSKSIEQPKPDLSKAAAIEGATEAITSGAKGLNKFAQDYTEDTAVKAAEDSTRQFGIATEMGYDKTFPGQLPQPGFLSTTNVDSLSPSKTDENGYDTSKVPQPIKDGLATATNVKQAREQGGLPGHIRETQFYADIYRKASELRAQFPAYRDYIDKGFEKVTGFTPNANAYLKSMIADMNEFNAKKNEAQDKVANKLLELAAQGNPVAAGLHNNLKAGNITSDYAVTEMAKSESHKYQGQVLETNMKNFNFTKEQQTDQAGKIISTVVPQEVHQAIEQHLTSLGLSPQKINDYIDGKIQIGSKEWEALDQSITQLEMQHRANFDTRNTKNGVRQALAENYSKHMDEAMQEYKMWHEALRNPESGYIGDVARATKFMSDQAISNVWNSNSPGSQFLKSIEIFNKMGGPNFAAATMVPGPDGTAMKPPTITELKGYMGNAMGGSQTPGLSTMKDTLTKGLNSKPGGAAKEEIQAYLRFPIKSVMDPNVPDSAKVNVLNHTFHGKDNDWIGLLNEDYTTKDATGKEVHIAGKHAVFLGYTDPRFVKEIDRLSSHNPQLMKDYHNWVLTTFSNDLFPKDIAAIPNMEERLGVDLVWSNEKKGEAPKFEARPVLGQFGYGAQGAKLRANAMNASLRNLNEGIKAVNNVIGENTTPTLMRLFGELGVDTTGTPTAAGTLLGALAARNKIEGSKKDQNPAPTPDRFPAALPRSQGTLNTAANQTPTGGAITQSMQDETKPWLDRAAPVNKHLPEDLHNAYNEMAKTFNTFKERFDAIVGNAKDQYKKAGF